MSTVFDVDNHPHRRWNPMTGTWILVSPHRAKRPWSGKTEVLDAEQIKDFDPENPLCPGVVRPNGIKNPDYKATFTFTNDFPALLEEDVFFDERKEEKEDEELFICSPVKGTCRVICFHPKSNISIPLMSTSEIRVVIDEWVRESKILGSKYEWVQIFENKGSIMGCSNPHPHCQIWASNFLPNEVETKDARFKAYYKKVGRPMLLDYAAKELSKKERVIDENEDWLCVVPYWAVWPYEVMIFPKTKHIRRMTDLIDSEKNSLADAMKRVTIKYDNLFRISFPYSMGFHGAPSLTDSADHWQVHAMYFPPLLRSASIKKFMVGYEMLANPQRDLTAEQAAKTLRDLPTVHYLNNSRK